MVVHHPKRGVKMIKDIDIIVNYGTIIATTTMILRLLPSR